MKRILFAATAIVVMIACNDSDSKTIDSKTADPNIPPIELADPVSGSDTTNFTSIEWMDSTFQQLGKIKEGQTPEITWKFKNTGDKPLVVLNATGTCGCTVAEKPEQPIAPGEEGVIKAKFSSQGRIGPNDKQVIVMTNTKGTTTHYLRFNIEVEKQ